MTTANFTDDEARTIECHGTASDCEYDDRLGVCRLGRAYVIRCGQTREQALDRAFARALRGAPRDAAIADLRCDEATDDELALAWQQGVDAAQRAQVAAWRNARRVARGRKPVRVFA